MTDRDLSTRSEGETLDLPEGMRLFAPGQVLGGRYEIREQLGRGGMGEVWRAFDLELRVEVALKAMRRDIFKDERRLELLQAEVRAAREVVSPNVCRIFDLIEVDGSEPHLLFGYEGSVEKLNVSPDGRWIASGGEDGIIRLWPMPDVSKPPLHTLPRQKFIAKLKTLTNLRAVRDETSSTGWSIEVGPFPGWAEVPEW